MSNTNTEVLTTAYENLQGALTQANTVLPPLQEAVEKGNLDNYATVSQLEEKASKTDVNTTNARIDNLIAVESTTDNAETTDIRVGADGTTYNSAGEAVRKQYVTLKGTLDNVVKEVFNEKIFLTNNYFDENACLNGYSLTLDTYEPVASETMCTTEFIPVKRGDVIVFGRKNPSSEVNSVNATYIAEYDENKKPYKSVGVIKDVGSYNVINDGYIRASFPNYWLDHWGVTIQKSALTEWVECFVGWKDNNGNIYYNSTTIKQGVILNPINSYKKLIIEDGSYIPTIQFSGLNNISVEVKGNVKLSGDNGLKFSGCNNVKIIGGIIDGRNVANSNGINLYMTRNTTIYGLRIENIGNENSSFTSGISAYACCDGLLIDSCYFNNIIAGKVADGDHAYANGVSVISDFVDGKTYYTKNAHITNCTFSGIDPQSDTIVSSSVYDGDGIYIIQRDREINGKFEEYKSNIIIDNCYFYNCLKRGIKASTKGVDITNCKFEGDMYTSAIDVQLGYARISKCDIYNYHVVVEGNTGSLGCGILIEGGNTYINDCNIDVSKTAPAFMLGLLYDNGFSYDSVRIEKCHIKKCKSLITSNGTNEAHIKAITMKDLDVCSVNLTSTFPYLFYFGAVIYAENIILGDILLPWSDYESLKNELGIDDLNMILLKHQPTKVYKTDNVFFNKYSN